MKIHKSRMFLALVLCTLCVVGTGCRTSRYSDVPMSFENISVVMSGNRSLSDAVLIAANHHRWKPQVLSPNLVRCTIIQRSNVVVVDVVLAEKSFSIRKVNSTVPERKYNQWANNLQREIVHQASR